MFPKKTKFKSKNFAKYNEIKSERPGGLSFPSKLEAATYDWLSLREKSGEIKIEKLQDHCYFTDARILYIYGLGKLTIVKGSYTNLRIDEVIIPKPPKQLFLSKES